MEGERRGANPDLTGVFVAAAVFLLLVGLGLLYLFAERRAREEARRIMCRGNLNQLAKGMATYLWEEGDHRWYPFPLGQGLEPDDFGGAEWLATLYWTRTIPDPGCFICPSSHDTNRNGDDLGSSHAVRGRFGSQTISYAGMHYRSLADEAGNPKPGAIPDDFPPNEAMASDDTQGTVNHRGTYAGMVVLFFDSHVEYWTRTKIDPERAVGMKGTELWRLRN